MKNNSSASRSVMFAGILLILTGLICNQWVLASLFSEDGVIALSGRILIWGFDSAMLMLGVFILIKRNTLNMRMIIYSFYAMLLVILMLEGMLHIAGFVVGTGKDQEEGDRLYLLSPFQDKEWADDLFKEFDEMVGEYKEIRGWGKKEYHGKYVNIDGNGVRRTWNPQESGNDKSKHIYMLGPSAVWGYGSRDDYTLPSNISKLLDEKGYSFVVHNYGEWSYSFFQQIVYLVMLLKEGHKPDYVIFYAWTDIYNAYQTGIPGTLHFDFSSRLKGQELSDMQHLWIGLVNIFKKNSMIYKQFMKVIKKLDPPEAQFLEVGHSYSDDQLSALLSDTMKDFSKSYEVLDKLSKTFGFQYLCIWPPILFTEEKPTEEELTNNIRLLDKQLMKMFKGASELYKESSLPHFYNISDVFKEKTKTYFLDFGHLSEEANGIIAKKVVSIFEKEYLLHE